MPQVGRNGHTFEFGFAVLNAKGCFIEGDVQRNRWARLSFCQGVLLNHIVGQHRDFVAWHVDRRQARATHLVDGAVGFNRQTRCCNVNAHHHGAGA